MQSTDPTAPAPSPDAAEWAVVEILGHRRHVGRVGEAERFGARFLRVDIPIKGDAEANGWRTLYYAPAAIFSIVPTTEDAAIAANTPYEYRARAITSAASSSEGADAETEPSVDEEENADADEIV